MATLINLAGNCREFRCLPGPGSLMDQDFLLIYWLNVVQDAWREREEKDAKQREQEARAKSHAR